MAMEDEWVALCERPPTKADADAQGCVLVWHELSGALICHISRIHANSFVTHWMRLPRAPRGMRALTED